MRAEPVLLAPGAIHGTTYPFVIIGAGAAGTCAAIEADRCGVRTVVLEAFGEPGGAASWSGGGTCLAGTAAQSQLGVDDGPELALADWERAGGPTADLSWARRYLESSREMDGWLGDLGVEWDEIVHEGDGNSVPRWHHPRGGGPELMRSLRAGTSPQHVDWVVGAQVDTVVRSGDRAAPFEISAGATTVYARMLLVATGGFTADRETVRRHRPDLNVLCGGAPHSRGSGHQLLTGLGATFVGLDRVWCYPNAIADHTDPTGTRGIVVRGMDNEVWVDPDGRRFHDESRRGGATGAPAVMTLPGSYCWAIVDAREIRRAVLAEPRFGMHSAPHRLRIDTFLRDSPEVRRAPSIGELAMVIGVPPDNLEASVDCLNEHIRQGLEVDSTQGRPLAGLRPISVAPFVAIRYRPLARKVLGGARTDSDCRVLDAHGDCAPGLFVSGEVAGMAGGSINGSAALEGTMIGPSMFSGRVAGRAVAAELPRCDPNEGPL